MIEELPQPDEQSIQLDAHVSKLQKLAEAADNIKFWTRQYEKLKTELGEVMGDATIGTVDGVEVVTYRYKDQFRGADFKRAYPDTYRLFVTEVTEKKFNVELFKSSRPDLYDQFKVRAMKSTFEA